MSATTQAGGGADRPGGAAPAPVVLVHGLYHVPAHFDAVAASLRAAGGRVVVPELHRGSLTADTAVVQEAVDGLGEPPVVLGHSYGGSVITGLRGVRHLVYLAAFVPDAGESAASLGGGSPALRDAILPAPGGATRLDPAGAAHAFYGDCPAPYAARATGLLRTQGPGHGWGVPERQAWRVTPSTYIVCALDRAVDPALQRRLATRCTHVQEWPTGHCPFTGRPELLVALLNDLRE